MNNQITVRRRRSTPPPARPIDLRRYRPSEHLHKRPNVVERVIKRHRRDTDNTRLPLVHHDTGAVQICRYLFEQTRLEQ